MTQPPPLSSIVQCSSTLAGLAYAPNTQALKRQLADLALPMNGQAELVWGPEQKGSNLVYVVAGLKTEEGRPYYVVAIRGTIDSVESIFEDVDLTLETLPWANPQEPQARITAGIADAVRHIQAMNSSGNTGGQERGLLEFLADAPQGAEIVVVGHSQGACLASVVSLWLHESLPSDRVIVPYTFAGETAGEKYFAEAANKIFAHGCRYFNRLDVVPRAWNESDLRSVRELFPGDGPKCDGVWKLLLDGAEHHASGKKFIQPEPAVSLPGQVYDKHGVLKFAEEISAQHNHLYYMWLTGVSLDAIHVLDANWQPPGT